MSKKKGETRPSFVGQYVTKFSVRNSISKYSVSTNPEFYGVVISEYLKQSVRTAEILIFPSGRTEAILKARLQLLPEEICDRILRSHVRFDEFQQKIKVKLNEQEKGEKGEKNASTASIKEMYSGGENQDVLC